MWNLVVGILGVGLTFWWLYFLGTHASRLFGEQVHWFDGSPTMAQRFRVAVVSSALTFLGCFAVAMAVFFAVPSEQTTRSVTVVPGSPAEQAGLQTGDAITAINSQAVDSFEEIQERIFANRGPLLLELRRHDETLRIEATPLENRLGIQSIMEESPRTPSQAFESASALFSDTFSNLVVPLRGSVQVMGPVGIVRGLSKEARGERFYLHVILILLSATWLVVPLLHMFDLATLALHRQRMSVAPHSRDSFNLLVLGAVILFLTIGGVILDLRLGAQRLQPIFGLVTKTCGFALTLASFTALRRHLSLRRAGALAFVGMFVGPILWIATFVWVRRQSRSTI